MTNVIEIQTEGKNQEARSALDALCLEGARRMLHRALELEVEEYLERHSEARDENGHALVTRNGKARTRQVTIGSGTMEVTVSSDTQSYELRRHLVLRGVAVWEAEGWRSPEGRP